MQPIYLSSMLNTIEGDTRSQGISSHDIDLILREHSGLIYQCQMAYAKWHSKALPIAED